ncbi:MAG: PID-CTERM protein-sorting domain-containing protein [Schleiferiaceae bacterium]
MRKLILYTLLVWYSLPAFSQSENPFEGTFNDMFELPDEPMPIPQGVMSPLNPAVPLDGGLTALLLAGGAAGYRQYKKKKKA